MSLNAQCSVGQFPMRLAILLGCLLLAPPVLLRAQASSEDQPAVANLTDPVIGSLGKRFWESSSERMTKVLTRLNNYSCIVHLERYERSRRVPILRKVDSVRLQVTSLQGAEYYSIPGKARSYSNPRRLVPTGLLATGIFYGYAQTVFVQRGLSRLEFLGADESGPRVPIRYRFLLNPDRHPLQLRVGLRSVSVPGGGVFWIDQKDLHLRRLTIENVTPIGQLGVRRALHVMDWAPLKTPSGEFLMPQRAEMSMEMDDGAISTNVATMAQCREYQAESTIRFDGDLLDATVAEAERAGPPGLDVPTEVAADDQAANARLVDASSLAAGVEDPDAEKGIDVSPSLFLPGGLALTMRLAEPLDLNRAVVGDEVRAVVAAPVTQGWAVVVPAGAEVQGRVRRLAVRRRGDVPASAWLEFTLLRARGQEYLFLGDFTGASDHQETVGKPPATRKPAAGAAASAAYADYGDAESNAAPVAGIAPLVFAGDAVVLPAGFELRWKTVAANP